MGYFLYSLWLEIKEDLTVIVIFFAVLVVLAVMPGGVELLQAINAWLAGR